MTRRLFIIDIITELSYYDITQWGSFVFYLDKSSTERMAKGLIWATAEDLASNRGRVLSLYRQILRSLNSPSLPLNLAERLAKKAEVRAIFMLGSEETSVHNIEDLFDTAEYALSILKKGEIPNTRNPL
ncbi:hypothetical protein SADUNF_Sadunf05G0067500 [Salix dunnii]|uniref:LYR motif containing domain-containing protein n=1 Tax=Salix dunnii TaxID=1413687 RepID=A0A835K762_9ROSI|nr:hypothetical protein SADUNF_Sadunf05G0067500 [Salix dunnii]